MLLASKVLVATKIDGIPTAISLLERLRAEEPIRRIERVQRHVERDRESQALTVPWAKNSRRFARFDPMAEPAIEDSSYGRSDASEAVDSDPHQKIWRFYERGTELAEGHAPAWAAFSGAKEKRTPLLLSPDERRSEARARMQRLLARRFHAGPFERKLRG